LGDKPLPEDRIGARHRQHRLRRALDEDRRLARGSPSAAASAISPSQRTGSAPDIASTASGAPLTKIAASPEG
ncbi:hypothetical protein CNY89_30075, partial [Amaricoccus sp. HAR-UPW-R2A-40]